MHQPSFQINKGIDFSLDLLNIKINEAAIKYQAEKITKKAISRQELPNWLLKAVACTDLTTLSGDDTPGFVGQLCARAKNPLSKSQIKVAAVCVYPEMVPIAVHCLQNSGISVAAVAAGFPSGLMPLTIRILEVEKTVEFGANEIDIVINRSLVLAGKWEELYYEIANLRQAADQAHLKVILSTGELGSFENIAKASLVAMMAGADFVKTSTGKETINAILPVGLVMLRMIKHYFAEIGVKIGFKPAGGIRNSSSALSWLTLVNEELGNAWLNPEYFRLGASSLLDDIENQLLKMEMQA